MSVLRTQIQVRCSKVAQMSLLADWAALDLTPDFSLRLSKDVQSLSIANKLLTESALAFSVPFSTTNDIVFGVFEPLVFDAPTGGIDCRVHVDGHELPFDKVFFKTKDSSRKQWELEFRRSPNHWLELASEKQLCTIDFGSETLDEATVTGGWQQANFDPADTVTSPVRWWTVDYGGWVDLAEPVQFTDPPIKGVWVEDLRPFFSVPETLRLGFCEIGWTLQGLIFETQWVRRLWQYILKRDYYTESRGGTAILVLSNTTSDENILGFPPIVQTTAIDYDPGTNVIVASAGLYWPAIVAPLPFRCKYRYCFKGFIENNTGADITIDGQVIECEISGTLASNFGAQLSDPNLPPQLAVIPAGQTVFVDVCVLATMNPGQTGLFLFGGGPGGGIAKKGYRITIEPYTQSLIRGDVPELRRLIDCDYYLLDMLKGFLQLVNGRIETDHTTKTITVYPFQTSTVGGDLTPGFIDDSDIIDLTGKMICDSARFTPVKNELSRYRRYQFADSSDAYITELDPLEPPHSRKVLNGIELKDQVDEQANEFWEPTLERQNEELKMLNDKNEVPYLPVMTDNLDGSRSFNILPRIVYAQGYTAQVKPQPNTDPFTWIYFEGTAEVYTGYATQRRTLDIIPFSAPDYIDGSVVFGTLAGDIYMTFYIGSSQVNGRGMWADILVMMSMNDWIGWNFRVPFLFMHEGRQITGFGENIRDFAPASELPTPMRLLVEPNVSECCDQPCSCRYTECDYYQDLGQFISQVTLDTLSITSFKVDQVEQLAAPVELGIVNVVNINGKIFVTNLIDALNELEIPYFSFSPSQQDYPEKEDWRFFKIKRPSCLSFEIIISAEGEVYRYRDTDMAQQWFDVTWSPFGYAENPISEPSNCVHTVEY